MNKIKLLFIFLFCISICCLAHDTYNRYTVFDSPNQIKTNSDGETLLLLDYSNSMNEMLFDKSKIQILLNSIKFLLSNMSENEKVGVRIYGQRWGLTPFDACKASSLVVPINNHNNLQIPTVLKRYTPRGMTPITYSLKQALKNDFKGSGNKHIILVTDGGENCDESPCTYAMELVKYRKDVKIDVIAINIDNYDDLSQLRCTANVTSGKLYRANSEQDLMKNLNKTIHSSKDVGAKILH